MSCIASTETVLCYAVWNLKTSNVLQRTQIVVGSRIKFDCLVFFFARSHMQSPVKLWKKLLWFSKEHVQKYSIRSWPGAAASETWGPWGRCLAQGYGWEAMGTGAHRGPVVLQGSCCTESFLCVAVYKFWGGSELILAAQSIANGPRTGPKPHPWASQSVWLQVSQSDSKSVGHLKLYHVDLLPAFRFLVLVIPQSSWCFCRIFYLTEFHNALMDELKIRASWPQ